MNYREAQDYLQSISSIGIVPGLDTIRTLLEELGNPQDDLKFVHIAGTNGKGSAGAYISYILAAAGYRVGRYVSPAVFDECEKIQVLEKTEVEGVGADGEADEVFRCSYIEKEAVAAHVCRIKSAVERMLKRGQAQPTAFEIETAMTFLELREKCCDIVVLEVGMGGRLDATNIVKNVECSVITAISMDHMAFLGDTLEKIAEEKAGIIKTGVAAVASPQKEDVRRVLKRKAQEAGAEILFADESRAKNVVHSFQGIDFTYSFTDDAYMFADTKEGQQKEAVCNEMEIHLPLLGMNQLENALTALEAVQMLKKKKGYGITEEAIKTGFSHTVWRGRFEIIKKQPVVIVDGAHNEGAAEKLAESLQEYILKWHTGMELTKEAGSVEDEIPENSQNEDNQKKNVDNFKKTTKTGGKLIYVFGIFKDKEVEKVIQKTAGLADIIFTVTPDSPRALSSEELKRKIESFWTTTGKAGLVKACGNVKNGVEKAMEQAEKNDVVVIFGSLSLLHEVLSFMKK